jgi:hypothetical protein
MKKLLLSIATVFAINASVNAQISLIGASINDSTGKIDLIQWDALDSMSVSVTPTFLDGYVFATSAFDSYNSTYYISGIAGDSIGLYGYNADSLTESIMTGSSYTNISEFDMSTGKMYNLIVETEENISVYEYNIATDQDSLIGVINEPGIIGVVADAIGFDSNNGIIYYVGYDITPSICLYAISVRDTVFSFTKTVLNTTAPINNIFGVNFDNVNETIFALNDTYDSTFNFIERQIIEINKTTGDIINRENLNEFPYYVGGSSCFDQNTSTYLLALIDTSNALKMLAYNTLTDSYEAGFIPSLVSEIVCDNSIFSKLAYSSTSINEVPVVDLNMYPNPVSETLSIEYNVSGPVTVQIASASGTQVFAREYNANNVMNVNLSAFAPGLYIVTLTNGTQTVSRKVMVQ